MSTMTYAKVSEDQKNLLARLIKQGRIDRDQLERAETYRDGERIVGVGNFSKAELSDWLEMNVFHNIPGEVEKSQVEALFKNAPDYDPR